MNNGMKVQQEDSSKSKRRDKLCKIKKSVEEQNNRISEAYTNRTIEQNYGIKE